MNLLKIRGKDRPEQILCIIYFLILGLRGFIVNLNVFYCTYKIVKLSTCTCTLFSHYLTKIWKSRELICQHTVLHNLWLYNGYFRGGFIFTNFASQSSQNFPLQFMSIYSNESVRKNIVKLSPREFLPLDQNHEIICTRKLWHIYSRLTTRLGRGLLVFGGGVYCPVPKTLTIPIIWTHYFGL